MNNVTADLEINKVISILMFSVGEVRFGVEAAQIAAIDTDMISRDSNSIKLRSLLGLADQDCDKGEKVALEVRQVAEGITCQILVDAIEEIVEIPLSEIQLLPELIADRALSNGMWGVFEQQGVTVLLIDFHRLLSKSGTETIE